MFESVLCFIRYLILDMYELGLLPIDFFVQTNLLASSFNMPYYILKGCIVRTILSFNL